MFVIIYLLLYFFCFVFTKPKAPPKQKQKVTHVQLKVKVPLREHPASRSARAEAQRVLKFGLQYRLLSFFYFQFEK